MDNTIKDYLSKNGKKGGETTKKLYGKEHFKNIGKLGGRPKKLKSEANLTP